MGSPDDPHPRKPRVLIDGQPYYQLSMSVNPGTRAAPSSERTGGFVGVVTLKAADKDGIAFCVPAELVERPLGLARRMSLQGRGRMQSRHRYVVVVRALQEASLVYEAGMRIHVLAMQRSRALDRDINEGLHRARNLVEERLTGEPASGPSPDPWTVPSLPRSPGPAGTAAGVLHGRGDPASRSRQ